MRGAQQAREVVRWRELPEEKRRIERNAMQRRQGANGPGECVRSNRYLVA
jgi:hypothetical protein